MDCEFYRNFILNLFNYYDIILNTWGSLWFRHILLNMTASGRNTLRSKLNLNDKNENSFAFANLAFAA